MVVTQLVMRRPWLSITGLHCPPALCSKQTRTGSVASYAQLDRGYLMTWSVMRGKIRVVIYLRPSLRIIPCRKTWMWGRCGRGPPPKMGPLSELQTDVTEIDKQQIRNRSLLIGGGTWGQVLTGGRPPLRTATAEWCGDQAVKEFRRCRNYMIEFQRDGQNSYSNIASHADER